MLDFEFCSHFRRTDICVLRYSELIVMISIYLRRKLFWCFCPQWEPFVAVQRRLLQTEEMVRRITLCHCFPFPVRLRTNWTFMQTHLDMILLMTFFTQGASGSKQTSSPVFFRVALQRQEEQISSRLDENVRNTKAPGEMWNRILVLHDLHVFAVGVAGDQLHLANVAPDGAALCSDAAAVLLHSQTPQAHSC